MPRYPCIHTNILLNGEDFRHVLPCFGQPVHLRTIMMLTGMVRKCCMVSKVNCSASEGCCVTGNGIKRGRGPCRGAR